MRQSEWARSPPDSESPANHLPSCAPSPLSPRSLARYARSPAQIRVLAADIVAKSNSGHPGAPMGMAPVAHILWTKIMKYNSKNSKWWNRDRFVLSNGHACVPSVTFPLNAKGIGEINVEMFVQLVLTFIVPRAGALSNTPCSTSPATKYPCPTSKTSVNSIPTRPVTRKWASPTESK